jgi:hypothetical protein
MTRVRTALLGLLIAAPLYLLLIDTFQSPELIAGSGSVVLAAAAYEAAYLESTENAAIRLRWLAKAWRPIAEVPLGIAIVCAEVLSQTFAPLPRRGMIETEPFATGTGDRHDLGRRALSEAVRSVSPHTIVIGVDSDSDRILIHHIRPGR